jgi:hypothetical protein
VQIDAVALPLDLVDLALAELLTASLERQHLRVLREMVERTANGPPPSLDGLGRLVCRNADGLSNAPTGNAPRFSRPPHRLVLC